MGLLSSSLSINRYKVDGKLKTPITNTILEALKKFCIAEIDQEPSEQAIGWTSFRNPFRPDFEGSSFLIGTYLIFSLRIDKKSIPAKIIQKHCALEEAKKLSESGRDFLTRNEKKMIKEHVINVLSLRIPATPNVYDLFWDYEKGLLYFFSNLKSANEALENLFRQSFDLTLIRLFPYSMAYLMDGLSASQKDALLKLTPSSFTE
jgi:DNA recombination-dependent growth factor C